MGLTPAREWDMTARVGATLPRKMGLWEVAKMDWGSLVLSFPWIFSFASQKSTSSVNGVKHPQPFHRPPKSHPGFWKTGAFPKINPGKLASPPGEEEPGWQGANGINPGKMGY